MRAQIQLLPDLRRLHLHDGPIDLIVEAFGTRNAIECAYQAAGARFVTVLDELCQELPLLRQPPTHPPQGRIARSMYAAVLPYAHDYFITPMAAVAGAVAEEVLWAMTSAAMLTRAYVNNGGDIALHLAPGECFAAGMIDHPKQTSFFGAVTLDFSQPARGIATSGWRGRSFSLGIADAVTVLADTAAQADAAATIIANAVDLPGHPAITRVPACSLSPDSDLGSRLVTQSVDPLSATEIAIAMDAGSGVATTLCDNALIRSVALHVKGETRVIPNPSRFAFVPKKDPRRRSMPAVQVRKKLTAIEEIFHEGGPVPPTPLRRGAALAVIHNPYAGKYVEDIQSFMDDLKPLGLEMARALVVALGGDTTSIQGYGKGAIVGAAGELEHGALWHAPGGYGMREVLGDAKAIVASTKKVGGPGTRLDVPITHINASYVRSHFDSMEVGITDAPRADEILLALVMTTGPRVHARSGGLQASEIKGVDGLR